MATLNYWDGVAWLPVSTGGSGGGTPGPAGADGISINVSGPQPTPPLNPRKGDQWLDSTVLRAAPTVEEIPSDPLEPIAVRLLPDPMESVTVRFLPDPPKTVFVSYLS